jgi:GntR family transcriptional regulator, uxu operon transcriptional repressor
MAGRSGCLRRLAYVGAEWVGMAAGAAEGSPAATATAAGAGGGTHLDRAQRLAERILVAATQSGLLTGGRLPTERQLGIDLGVTRSAVRHALAVLEAQGRISREVGRGTFLHDGDPGRGLRTPASGPRTSGDQRPGWTMSAPAADFAPADVMTIRRLLEPPAMSLVVSWATAADLQEMQRCLTGGDGAATFEEFEGWDLALHRCIMAASHSPLLIALYQAIEEARHGQVWGDLKRRSMTQQRRALYQSDHHAIVAALSTRDSGQAVEAMRRHLARVQEHLNVTDPAAGVSWQ